MAFAGIHADHKKKSSHHVDRNRRDGATGMSASTKKHFDHVKQKLFAFVGQQNQTELDGMHLAPPPSFHHNTPPPPIFADHMRTPKLQIPHRSPVPPRKHLQTPVARHKQLPHLALATPQVARREGKPRSNRDGRLTPNMALF